MLLVIKIKKNIHFMCQKLFQKAFWSIIIRKKRQKAILRL